MLKMLEVVRKSDLMKWKLRLIYIRPWFRIANKIIMQNSKASKTVVHSPQHFRLGASLSHLMPESLIVGL
jgi:hypothetical protein